jgi:16S rRNA (cytidine1402-2'-O)-methyltransferase
LLRNIFSSKLEEMTKALYLIPVTLGENDINRVLPSYNHDIIVGIKYFIVENIKSAIRFLKLVEKEIDISKIKFYELNEHTDLKTIGNYLDPLKKGFSMGVISEAGCPAVADPGAAVVEMAQKQNLKVIPLVGPSSMIMALMASGMNGQSFAFNGYLPVKPGERAKKLSQLEARSAKENQTELFIEAPYRNLKMLETILSSLRPDTRLCIAAGITTQVEYIHTYTVEQWKKMPSPDINKIPAIFLIYANQTGIQKRK